MTRLAFVVPLALALACKLRDPNPPAADPCEPNPCAGENRNRCVNQDGNPRCLCNEGFVTRPNGGCEALSAQNCPEHAGDPAEPDDCMARAQEIAPLDPLREQTIDPISDYDFFAMSAKPGHVYQVSVNASGSLYPRIDLYDEAGVWRSVAELTRGSDTQPVTQPRLYFKHQSTTDGRYLVRVSQSPIDPSFATGGYTVTLKDNGLDDYGDGPTTAARIVPTYVNDPPEAFSGKLDFPGDEDWATFQAYANQQYELAFDTTGAVPGVALFRENSSDPLLNRLEAVTVFTVPSDGVYLLRFSDRQQAPAAYAFTFRRQLR